VDLVINGHPIEVKWIGKGRLGDVRDVLKKRPAENLVVVARHLSPGAREALSDAGISWVDETGAAEIVIASVVISRPGVQTKESRQTKNWTPAVQAVAEALLCGTNATQTSVQSATGLSAGAAANALRFLTDSGLLTADAKRGPNSGRRIVDTRALLDTYADSTINQKRNLELQIGITWQDIVTGLAKLGQHWERTQTEWAVTGAAAAAVIAPFLSSVSNATVYVNATSIIELEAVARDANLRPISGGRLRLKPFPTVSVRRLSNIVEGLRVAPWPRVYADLRTEGVRGEEAAEHLFEVCHDR
jgi:hypothetical protein